MSDLKCCHNPFDLPRVVQLLSVFCLLLSGPGLGQHKVIEYPFALKLAASAAENATSAMGMAMYGSAVVTQDGIVSGEGVIVYEYLKACEWAPPAPQPELAPFCKLTGVTDGNFTVAGKVLRYVNAGSGDPLEEALHTYLHAMGTEVARMPAELEITLTPGELPQEHMLLWGFPDPMTRKNIKTGVGFLAAAGAGVFDKFSVAPVLAGSASMVPDAGHKVFSGAYAGGTPTFGYGALNFIFANNTFLKASPAWVIDSKWVPAAPETPQITVDHSAQALEEIRHLAVLASMIEVEPAQGWDAAWEDVVDGITESTGGGSSAGGLPATGLMDDTRPKGN